MVESTNTVDPASLPLPTALIGVSNDADVDDGDYPVEHLSVIFNQKEKN